MQFCTFLEGRCVDESIVARFREQKVRMVAVYNVLNFNHLVFQRTRLVEGLQGGLKLIHKYLKCSIHFVKIVIKRKE